MSSNTELPKTWRRTEALGMADPTGAILPGMQADIIVLDGAVARHYGGPARRIVRNGGAAYKNAGAA